MNWFGRRWDAPVVDPPATELPTPVGDACLWCEEPIEAGDCGLWMHCVVMVDGESVGVVKPIHMECQVRQALGGIAHLEGRCSCRGSLCDPDDGLPLREAARVAVEYVERVLRHGNPL